MSNPANLHASIERDAPTYLFLGVPIRILLSARQTGRRFSMVEGIMPPGGDGGLHVHMREDESMHLLEGALEVTIGQEIFTLTAGSSYFAPRGIPHRLRNTGAPARGIVVTTPGGFDEFIAKAGIPITDGVATDSNPPSADQIAELLRLAENFGIRIIAPPASS